MLTRRDCLTTGGGALAATLAGCLTDLGLARTGELQLKAVLGGWTHRGRRYRDQVLFVALDGDGVVHGRVDEPLAELVTDPTAITVPDAVHETLQDRFESVEYVLGLCGPGFDPGEPDGCLNTGATRRGFNRVHFGDRAEVRVVEDTFRVVDVYEGEGTGWHSEVATFDFDELHADHGR